MTRDRWESQTASFIEWEEKEVEKVCPNRTNMDSEYAASLPAPG